MIALDIDVLIMSKASPIQVRHYEQRTCWGRLKQE